MKDMLNNKVYKSTNFGASTEESADLILIKWFNKLWLTPFLKILLLINKFLLLPEIEQH
jgi:hypothetical protein